MIVIGHRGASAYYPEHTAPAYRLALWQGADAVEPDIVPTRDGVLLVRHEPEIGGTTNVAEHPEFADRRTEKSLAGTAVDGWFAEDFTWRELQSLRAIERIPAARPASADHDESFSLLRLADVLRFLDEAAEDAALRADDPARHVDGAGAPAASAGVSRPRVVIEIKHAKRSEELGYPLDELLERELLAAGWSKDDDRITFESFEPRILERMHAAGWRAPLVLLLENEGVPEDFEPGDRTYDEWASDPEAVARFARGVSVGLARLAHDPGLVTRMHAAGLVVYTWTLRAENAFLPAEFQSSEKADELGRWEKAWGSVYDTGVDGVFADAPDLAVRLRRQRERGSE